MTRIDLPDLSIYITPLTETSDNESVSAVNVTEAPSRRRERLTEYRLLDQLYGSGNWELTHTPTGSPELIAGGERISLSISHSRKYLAIAISLKPNLKIGIDIEYTDQRLSRLSGGFLSAEEEEQWKIRPEHLLRAWTAKEAAYKAFDGASHSLRALRLQPPCAPTPATAIVCYGAREAHITFITYDDSLIAIARLRK